MSSQTAEVVLPGQAPPLPWYRQPLFLRLASIVVVLSVWEAYGRTIPVIFISRPSAIVAAAADLMSGWDFWQQLAITMVSLLVGFGVAIVVGCILGFLMGRNRTLSLVLDPYVTVLYATPRIALIPLLIMIFGIDTELRLAMVFLSSMFPVLINTMNGVRTVETDLIETAVSFNANERQILRTVILPATTPFVLSGIQIALGHAIIGVIVAEMTVAISGIGGLIVAYGNAFKTDYMFVPLLATSALSILLVQAIRVLERELMPYRFLGGRRRSSLWARMFGARLPARGGGRDPGVGIRDSGSQAPG